MDENTWKFSQLLMWLIGIQTTALIALFGGFCYHFNRRLNDNENQNKDRFNDIFGSFEKRFIESINQNKDQFFSLEKRIIEMDQKIDRKLDFIDQKFEKKLDFIDQKFDKKLELIEQKFEKKIDHLEQKFEKKFDVCEVKLTSIDSRQMRLENDMIEVKTILRMKECCMIQDDRQLKKAE